MEESTKDIVRKLILEELRIVINRATWDTDTTVEVWLGEEKISYDSFYEGEGRERGCW